MRAYPEYRDSGVEWLGKVPVEWEVVPLRRIVTLNPSKSESADRSRDEEVSFIPMEAVGENGELDLSRTRPISEVGAGYTYFRDGDMTFAKITPCFENGKRALMRNLVGGIGFGTTELTVLRPDLADLTPDFLFWLVSSPDFRRAGEAHMYGAGGQKRVPDDFVRGFRAPLPPIAEQRAIAVFLDREVAKIDALIEESRALIAALAEKRQATISHAVTRGLNPAARLKPSGVDWLGDIPEGWEVVRICFIARFTGGGTPARDQLEFWGGNIPWVSPKDMKVRHISSTEETITEEGLNNSAANLIDAGSALLVVRSGILKHTIPVAIADVPVSINQDIRAAVFDRDRMSAKFFVYFVEGYNDALLVLWRKQGATVESIEHQYLANSPILLPTLKEQEAIVTHLDAETARLDALTEEANAAIALLQERRAALISAAVTGKIDIRDAVQAA